MTFANLDPLVARQVGLGVVDINLIAHSQQLAGIASVFVVGKYGYALAVVNGSLDSGRVGLLCVDAKCAGTKSA